MTDSSIGLIGVGLVGTALAERWQRAGWSVTGFDLDPQFRSRLEAVGGTAAASVQDVIAASNIVVLSLPNSAISSTLLHEHISALRRKVVIDTTTGEPSEMAALGQFLAQHDTHYLDATIAGSSVQVRSGEVLVMIGGEAEVAARCHDVFTPFASHVFHLGPWGAGAEMKLVVNLVLGLHRAVLAEGLMFAERLGIDPRRALDVLQASPAASRVMQTKGEKMLTGDFTPQARLSQHYKDVRLILAAGEAASARLPLSQVHAQLLAEREAAGDGELDNSAIIRAFMSPEG